MDLIEVIASYGRALSVDELADLIHISAKTLYRHIRAKKLPAYHIGGQVRLDPRRTAEWLRTRLR
jgi:excisionase family DNA binding protein